MPRSDPLRNCSSRLDRKTLKEVSENLEISSRDIHARLATVNIKLHASSIKNVTTQVKFSCEVDKEENLAFRKTVQNTSRKD